MLKYLNRILIYRQWQRLRGEMKDFIYRAKYVDEELYKKYEEAFWLLIFHIDSDLEYKKLPEKEG